MGNLKMADITAENLAGKKGDFVLIDVDEKDRIAKVGTMEGEGKEE